MLDPALTPEALAYFRSLPAEIKMAVKKSNVSFRSTDDLKDYAARMDAGLDGALYQTLPEPAIPSNAALDPLDAE